MCFSPWSRAKSPPRGNGPHGLTRLCYCAALKTAEAEAASAAEACANAGRMKVEQAKRDRDDARRELAAGFERKIAGVVEAVTLAASEMQGLSSSMNSSNAETMQQTAAAANASTQASENVGTVASATEELTASINGTAEQVTRSAQIAAKAAEEARRTNTVVESLAASTQKIGEVVTLIQSIASQTNLLALNATIEAARAEDHGRGFAVVASEVKALANQTAKATEEISMQIQDIQTATGEAVNAIESISGTIAEIDQISARSPQPSINRAQRPGKLPETCKRPSTAPMMSTGASITSAVPLERPGRRRRGCSMRRTACRCNPRG
jgi:methyl-accepting chemotaxis protein